MLYEERREDSNRVYYVRTASPLWNVVELAAETIGLRWENDSVHLGQLNDS
ncbi:Uncharacterised protein [Mycobacteroides abscessus]|uniref:hypothetical protein n=1 Tax=Mycobacteroides abscessus TaxID=36809 RepID=UPI0002DE47B6|nr:hypothetical protein [Mycobacteroides abscessus]CPT82256.1 Uncharacterised protein [Mycobacteroides abscessus]CPU63456.1 Uncharacterised protein [Mycobacteroides abscessus]SKG53644.1 Uncharacterised protein [Mycobacteroides abscessus subsp. massiliense]SKH48475.1 Uncharacterised protein [Mycobacteroides abscessus subsp. massiliense]SKH97093.1 Uncharacterised protein [Mycobacteroides abscessus subsp. massiliense]